MEYVTNVAFLGAKQLSEGEIALSLVTEAFVVSAVRGRAESLDGASMNLNITSGANASTLSIVLPSLPTSLNTSLSAASSVWLRNP